MFPTTKNPGSETNNACFRPDYDLSDQVNLSPAGEHEGQVVEAGLQEERECGSLFIYQVSISLVPNIFKGNV